MPKPNKRKKVDMEGNNHRPKKDRPHIAQEYADLNNADLQSEMTRNLLGWARNSATGRRTK